MTGKARVQSTSRVVGHGLLHKGWPYWITGERAPFRADPSRGKCECGEMSEPVETIAERRRWHREHKEAVRRS